MSQHKSHQSHRIAILAVSGMTCGGCANTVARILSRVPDVAEATVDLKAGLATIKGAASLEDIIAAVDAAGYGAKAIEPGVGAGEHDGSH